MTDDTTNTSGASIAFDDWRTILFAVFMALVAMVIYGGIFFYMHTRKSANVEGETEAA